MNNQTLTFSVQNIVSTYKSGVRRLNLKKLCQELKWCQINNEVFAALIGRIKDPKTTILTFTSSNNVCTGAKTVIESRIACRVMAYVMQKHGYEVTVRDFEVQNIVASAYTGFPLRLEDIAINFAPDASFDAEVFPGLIYRMKNPKIVFLVFREGKLVITGGKQISELSVAANIFYNNVLLPYRDSSETLNYVPTTTPGANLASIVSELVDQFGDENEVLGHMNDDLGDELRDLHNNYDKLDEYERQYRKQLESM